MKLQVLLSAMNLNGYKEICQSLNVQQNMVIINQANNDVRPLNLIDKTEDIQFLSFQEKGLSKSRNRALENSDADICVIADDDLRYEDNFKKSVIDAYENYPDADAIAFHVERKDKRKNQRKGQINLIGSMKLSSVQLTFRRTSVTNNGITFNERFGAGTDYYMGEENIFLSDCLRAGLKIYYLPIRIAVLNDSESTWFRGYSKQYFEVKGRVFYNIAPLLSALLILQFAIRKRRLYNKEVGVLSAIRSMFRGAWLEITSHEK